MPFGELKALPAYPRKTYTIRITLTTSTSVSSKKRIILFFNTTLKNNRLKTCAFTTIFTSPNTRSSRQPTKKHVYKINYIPIAIHQYHPRSSSHYVRIVSTKRIHDKKSVPPRQIEQTHTLEAQNDTTKNVICSHKQSSTCRLNSKLKSTSYRDDATYRHFGNRHQFATVLQPNLQ